MTEGNNREPGRKSFWDITLSETLLLAIVPFLAYLFTFVYQAGFLKAFEIPFQFVSISIVDVFNSGIQILAVFVVVLMTLNLFSILLPRGKLPYSLAKRISTLLPVFLYLFPIFLFKWGIGTSLKIFSLLALLVITFILFLPPLITRKYKGSYLQRMEMLDHEEKTNNPWEGSLLDRTLNLIGYKAFVAIIYFSLFINLTYNAGKANALNQEIFPIANTTPETVVLFMTNDRLISALFNKDTNVVKPEFTIINIKDSINLQIHLENVGHLVLDKSSLTSIPPSTIKPYPTKTPANPPSPTGTATP